MTGTVDHEPGAERLARLPRRREEVEGVRLRLRDARGGDLDDAGAVHLVDPLGAQAARGGHRRFSV